MKTLMALLYINASQSTKYNTVNMGCVQLTSAPSFWSHFWQCSSTGCKHSCSGHFWSGERAPEYPNLGNNTAETLIN